jgi:predicted DNA-binding transcriptional regulator YafY
MEWIELPQKIPYALSDKLNAQLSPAAQTAAEQAASQVSERIKQLIDGYAPRYPFPEQTLPQEQSLPLIQQALQQGDYLDITYWSAGRGERTHRIIEPYRLEWRQQIAYLVAFCQQAHSERRFRLDRIEAIQLIENDNPEDEGNDALLSEDVEAWWLG